MRKNHYKAWCKDSKSLVYPNERAGYFEREDDPVTVVNELLRKGLYIFMQGTRLKDKTHTEIFEGDICKVHSTAVRHGDYITDWEILAEVVFEDYMFSFVDVETARKIHFFEIRENQEGIEIVSNIFEREEERLKCRKE